MILDHAIRGGRVRHSPPRIPPLARATRREQPLGKRPRQYQRASGHRKAGHRMHDDARWRTVVEGGSPGPPRIRREGATRGAPHLRRGAGTFWVSNWRRPHASRRVRASRGGALRATAESGGRWFSRGRLQGVAGDVCANLPAAPFGWARRGAGSGRCSGGRRASLRRSRRWKVAEGGGRWRGPRRARTHKTTKS